MLMMHTHLLFLWNMNMNMMHERIRAFHAHMVSMEEQKRPRGFWDP